MPGRSEQMVRRPLNGVGLQRATHRRAPGGAAAGAHPQFVYHGGRVITDASVHALFLGDWSSPASQRDATRLRQFLTDYFASPRMNILSQYGCGTSPTLAGSAFRTSTGNHLTASDINAAIQAAIDDGDVPEPTNGNEVCILYLDDATAVHDGSITMCAPTSDTAFGFHDHFTTKAGNDLPFAVIPGLTDACLKESCPNDSSCSLHLGETQEQRRTQVTSHEFDEMVSDPDLDAWYDDSGGGENGDLCNGQSGTITVGARTWTVQLEYSKWHDQQTNGATQCLAETDTPTPSLLPAGSGSRRAT